MLNGVAFPALLAYGVADRGVAETCESTIEVDAALESARGAAVNALRIGAPFAALVGEAQPFAFVLPSARFEVVSERV